MLIEYVQEAMRRARYVILEDDESYYGEIPGLRGVYANARTLETCREELQEVLEGWLFIRLRRNLPIPTLRGISLSPPKSKRPLHARA